MIVFHFLFQVFAAGLWDYSPLCDQPCTPGPVRRRSSVPRPLWRGFLRRSWARSCPCCSFLTAGRLCPLLGTAEDRAGGGSSCWNRCLCRPQKAPPLGLSLAVGFHGRPVSGWRNSLLSLVRVFSNSWILSSDFSASIKRVIQLRFSSLSPSWYGELHYWVCNFILVVSGFGLMAMLVL